MPALVGLQRIALSHFVLSHLVDWLGIGANYTGFVVIFYFGRIPVGNAQHAK